VILIASIAGIALYAWLIYAYTIIVLQVTAFLAVAAVLVILAWSGWTMATTPPLEPIEFETPSATPSETAEMPQAKKES